MNPTGRPGLAMPPAMSAAPQQGISSGMMAPPVFSYQMGGMIGPGGAPAGLQMGAPMGAAMPALETRVGPFANRNPEPMQELRMIMMQAMQSGQLTQPELNTLVQAALAAARNPEMYPYVRQFLVEQGLGSEQGLPQQYDQRFILAILMAARAIQADLGGQNMMQGGSPAMAGIPSMKRGGEVPESKRDDGAVLINAHEGEYVIPAHVVRMKGQEFFDSLVEKYSDQR